MTSSIHNLQLFIISVNKYQLQCIIRNFNGFMTEGDSRLREGHSNIAYRNNNLQEPELAYTTNFYPHLERKN